MSLFGVCVSALVLTLASSEALLDRFTGDWKGEGRVLGMESRLTMRWEPVLDGRFVKLSFRNEMRNASAETQVFEGHAYYKPDGIGHYRGTWFDSSGALRPIEASAEGDALTSDWGTAETERGRTVYRLTDDGGMEVTDFVHTKDGPLRPFGQSRFKRAP